MKALIIADGNIGLCHIQGPSKIADDQKYPYLFDTNKTYRSRFENEFWNSKKKQAKQKS